MMAGNADALSFNIIAVNAASPELVKLQKDLQDTAKAVQQHGQTVVQYSGAGAKGMRDFTESVRPVLAATRGMATEIASTLNPALGNLVGGLTLVARGAGTLGLALGGVTAAVVVGGVAFKNYLDVQGQVAEAQAKINLAARSFDLGGAKGMVAGFALELDTLDQRATGLTGRWITGWRKVTDALGQTVDAVKGLAAAQAAVEAVVPAERALGLAQQRALQIAAGRQHLGVGLGRAESQAQLADFEGIVEVMRGRLRDESAQIIETIRRESEREFAAALATRQPGSELSRITELGIEKVKTFGEQRDAARAAFEESVRRGRAGIIERRFPSSVSQGDPFGQVTAEEGMRAGEEAVLGIRRGRAVNVAELAAAEAQARTQVLGLTHEARLELELQAIAAAKTLAFAQAEGKENQDHVKALAEIQAITKTQLELQKSAEETNPLAGLSAGFRDAARAAEASGAIMHNMATETASNMQRAFSDQFFSVITGDFKKLPDIGRQFGLAMVRSLTDAFATMATAPLLRSLQQGLGLSGPQGFVRGLGPLGAGMSAGGLVEVGGQLFQSVAAGGGQTVLVPMTAGAGGGASAAAHVTAAGGGAGGGGGFLSLFSDTTSAIKAFLNTPLSSVAPSLFGGGSATVSAGSTAFEMASLGEAGANIQAMAAGSGATIGSTLGAVGALAGLAFTVYNGLSGPPTAQNIASGAVSGALSGAMLGTMISPGWGTVIGAIGGALVGGGAAAMGKEDPNIKKQRQQAEINRAIGAAQGLGGAVQATNSLQELFDLLVANGSGYVGGTAPVAIVSYVYPSGQPRVGDWLMVGYPNPYYPVCTVEEFAKYGGTSYVAVIQAGVDPSTLAGPNANLEQVVRAKIRQLTHDLAQIEVSTSDVLVGTSGGRVTRTTTFRADRAKEFAGQELSVEGRSLVGMDENQKIAFLKDLAKLDKDLNLNILFRDPSTDEIVSLSLAS